MSCRQPLTHLQEQGRLSDARITAHKHKGSRHNAAPQDTVQFPIPVCVRSSLSVRTLERGTASASCLRFVWDRPGTGLPSLPQMYSTVCTPGTGPAFCSLRARSSGQKKTLFFTFATLILLSVYASVRQTGCGLSPAACPVSVYVPRRFIPAGMSYFSNNPEPMLFPSSSSALTLSLPLRFVFMSPTFTSSM